MKEGNLSELRKEILEALNTFLAHIKYTITIMATLVAAGVAVPAFSIENKVLNSYYLIGSSIIFLMLVVVSFLSRKICRRYYLIYACNYIYYARIHIKNGDIEHPWVVDLSQAQKMSEEEIFSENAEKIFLNGEKSTDKNSWYYYRTMINSFLIIGVFGVVVTGYMAWCNAT